MHICMYVSMCLCGCLCVYSLTVELSTIICIPPCPTPPPTGHTNTHTHTCALSYISLFVWLCAYFLTTLYLKCAISYVALRRMLQLSSVFFCVVVVLAVVVDLCLSSITSQHVATVHTYKMFIHTHYIVLYKRRQSYFKANISAICIFAFCNGFCE